MATRIYVSDDLSIMTYGPNLVIQSQAGHDMGTVGVNEAELPALIARLTAVAAERGVETTQGELVKALKEIEENYGELNNESFAKFAHSIAEQVLASVK